MNNEEFKFEFPWDTTDEEDEEMLESIRAYAEELKAAAPDEYIEITDPVKVNLLMKVYHVLCALYKGSGVEVTYSLQKDIKSMGVVSIISNSIVFPKARLLSQLTKAATATDVYARADGRIQMDFTFHGLTQKMEV